MTPVNKFLRSAARIAKSQGVSLEFRASDLGICSMSME